MPAVAELEEQVGNRDIHRADFIARAAEAGGFGKIGELFEVLAGEER
jgi:hypothetical protein